MRPLVSAQAPLGAVVPPIEEAEHVEAPVMGEGHAVAHTRVVAARAPVEHGLPVRAEDLPLSPSDLLAATGERQDLLVSEGAVPEGGVIDPAAETRLDAPPCRLRADQARDAAARPEAA